MQRVQLNQATAAPAAALARPGLMARPAFKAARAAARPARVQTPVQAQAVAGALMAGPAHTHCRWGTQICRLRPQFGLRR